MVEKTKEKLKAGRRDASPAVPVADLLSTGSTLVNLACTDRPRGGFAKGHYHIYIGDSASGKTFLALSSLAEAAMNPAFEGYRLIYDATEAGALMDFSKFFGPKMAARLEPPSEDGPSKFTEEFYYNLEDVCKKNKPFIYVLDSMDGMQTKHSRKKFLEAKAAHEKGGKAKGDFGDGKAKVNSTNIRAAAQGIQDLKSILIIISQSRDNIDAGMFGPKQVYAGGRALKFYAAHEIWTTLGGRIYRNVRGKKRTVGIRASVSVKKNRLTGKERTVKVPIYYSVGLDEIGGMVDYLVDEGHWKAKKGKDGEPGEIIAPDFDFRATREDLVHRIEEGGLEKQLRAVVAGVWADVEEACKIQRKPRYE